MDAAITRNANTRKKSKEINYDASVFSYLAALPLDPILETTKEGAAPSFDSPRRGTRIETFMPHREYGFSHSNNGGEF